MFDGRVLLCTSKVLTGVAVTTILAKEMYL